IYENTFIYKNNASGENHEFTVETLPKDWENWTFVDRVDKLIQKGDDPKCKDFAITDANGSDVTNVYMEEEQPIFVLIIPNIKKMNDANLSHVKDVLGAAVKDGHYSIALTGSNIEDVESKLN